MAAIASLVYDGCICHSADLPHPIGYGTFLTDKSANPDASVSSVHPPPYPPPPPIPPTPPKSFPRAIIPGCRTKPRVIRRRVRRSTCCFFLVTCLPLSLSLHLELTWSLTLALCSCLPAPPFVLPPQLAASHTFPLIFLSIRQPCRTFSLSDWHSPASVSLFFHSQSFSLCPSPTPYCLIILYSFPHARFSVKINSAPNSSAVWAPSNFAPWSHWMHLATLVIVIAVRKQINDTANH